jgi:hypothetical protein
LSFYCVNCFATHLSSVLIKLLLGTESSEKNSKKQVSLVCHIFTNIGHLTFGPEPNFWDFRQ